MNKYEIILNVCETHSISKTASKLNYTQSAISQAIKSYEKELGFPIFKRSKHGMEPIPGTEDVFASLRIICQEEEKIQLEQFKVFPITGFPIFSSNFQKFILISVLN